MIGVDVLVVVRAGEDAGTTVLSGARSALWSLSGAQAGACRDRGWGVEWGLGLRVGL